MKNVNIIASKIVKRENPNDVFLTPISVVNIHLELLKKYVESNDIIFDGFYGTGNYYNAFSSYFQNNPTDFTEITLNKDFFEYDKKVDVICSNPPYSLINKVLEKSVALRPHTISYLIGMMNFTNKRTEYMNNNGYYLAEIHFTKINKWFGMSLIVVFTNKVTKNCISFDRVVHR